MKLIDADTVITANLYDDEHEEFLQKKITVGELVDFCSEEGCPEAVEAIPVAWIEGYIKGMKNPSNGYYTLTSIMSIEMMVKHWREEQK